MKFDEKEPRQKEALQHLKVIDGSKGSGITEEERKSIEESFKKGLEKNLPLMLWWLYLASQMTAYLSPHVATHIKRAGGREGNTTVALNVSSEGEDDSEK